MGDETKPETTTPKTSAEPVYVAQAVAADDRGVQAAATIAVQGGSAVIVAQFANMDSAKATYEALRRAEAERGIGIDGVLVVNADEKGKVHIQKMTDHTTRTGFAWGAVAGIVLGIIFPPSILASAAAVGIAGAAVGKIGNEIKKSSVADALTEVIGPGQSGIIALVDIAAVDSVKREMPTAQKVESVPVSAETADAIKQASADVKTTETAPAG